MNTEQMSNSDIIEYYRKDAMELLRYLPWLMQKSGGRTYSNYGGDGISANSMSFPVYDSTLMSFIKTAQKTCFMDRNYRYVYSRNRLKTEKDELVLIDHATVRDMDKLAGILSHYVMGGQTKAALWSAGVEKGIYVAILSKIKELIEFWDGKASEIAPGL